MGFTFFHLQHGGSGGNEAKWYRTLSTCSILYQNVL